MKVHDPEHSLTMITAHPVAQHTTVVKSRVPDGCKEFVMSCYAGSFYNRADGERAMISQYCALPTVKQKAQGIAFRPVSKRCEETSSGKI